MIAEFSINQFSSLTGYKNYSVVPQPMGPLCKMLALQLNLIMMKLKKIDILNDMSAYDETFQKGKIQTN